MSNSPLLIIAHRGARAFAPENTIEAIEKAAQINANAVEIDVQISADGYLIVLHDDDLIRCSNARTRFPDRNPWLVSDFELSEIQSLDAGSWFVDELRKPIHQRDSFLQYLTNDEIHTWITQADIEHYSSGKVRIPTLTDCLLACARLRLELHLELKAIPRFYPRLADKVVDEVHRRGVQRDVIISSFDHQQLARVRALTEDIRTAVLTSDRLYHPAEYVRRLGASAYCPGCYGSYDSIGFGSVTGELDSATIDAIRKAGYAVNVWTENDKKRMEILIGTGVTGIFTDYPNRLVQLLSEPRGQ